ncbi:Protein ABHD16B [Manis javanica]|nr:Protein ABHD16B [Manis javanica]
MITKSHVPGQSKPLNIRNRSKVKKQESRLCDPQGARPQLRCSLPCLEPKTIAHQECILYRYWRGKVRRIPQGREPTLGAESPPPGHSPPRPPRAELRRPGPALIQDPGHSFSLAREGAGPKGGLVLTGEEKKGKPPEASRKEEAAFPTSVGTSRGEGGSHSKLVSAHAFLPRRPPTPMRLRLSISSQPFHLQFKKALVHVFKIYLTANYTYNFRNWPVDFLWDDIRATSRGGGSHRALTCTAAVAGVWLLQGEALDGVAPGRPRRGARSQAQCLLQ